MDFFLVRKGGEWHGDKPIGLQFISIPIAGVTQFNGYRDVVPPDIRSLADIEPGQQFDDSALTNPLMVAQFGRVPILGKIPWASDDISLQERIDLINSHVALDTIIDIIEGR